MGFLKRKRVHIQNTVMGNSGSKSGRQQQCGNVISQLCSINSGRRWTKDSHPSISLCYMGMFSYMRIRLLPPKHLKHSILPLQPSPSARCTLLSEPCLSKSTCSTMQSPITHTHTHTQQDQHARQHVVPHPSLWRCNPGVVHQIPSIWTIQHIDTPPPTTINQNGWQAQGTGFTVT